MLRMHHCCIVGQCGPGCKYDVKTSGQTRSAHTCHVPHIPGRVGTHRSRDVTSLRPDWPLGTHWITLSLISSICFFLIPALTCYVLFVVPLCFTHRYILCTRHIIDLWYLSKTRHYYVCENMKMPYYWADPWWQVEGKTPVCLCVCPSVSGLHGTSLGLGT